jgi:iron complex transport system permease protein
MDGASAILPAWAGAFLFTALILWASARLKDNLSLLIFGVMLGSVGSAIISLLQYISKAEALKNYVLWSMGSFSGTDLQQVGILAGLCLVGILLSFSNIKNLNVLYSGEQYAISLGLSPRRMRRRILLAVAILAGSTTAFCGPIGFVGIAVPHIARILLRDADHRRLMPATLLCGCAIMLLADCIAQLPGSTGIIPINTVTALLGIPVILIIILKQPE